MAYEYYPGTSLLHKCDPRTKLVLFLYFIILVTAIQDPLGMFVLLLIVIGFYRVAGIPMSKVRGMLISLLPVIVLFVVLNIFVVVPPNARIIGYIGSQPVAIESLIMGLTGGLRFTLFVFFARLVTMTTSISDLLVALTKIKMPVEFVVSLGIAFSSVGVLINQLATIKEAQMSRGSKVESKNPWIKAKALISVVVPGIYLTILRGMDIAKTVESRAFTYNPSKRTMRKTIKFSITDYIIILMGGVLTAVVVAFITLFKVLYYTYSFDYITHYISQTLLH